MPGTLTVGRGEPGEDGISRSGKWRGADKAHDRGRDKTQGQVVLNSDNPPREVSSRFRSFEIGTELVRTKVYDFGRTESNEKTTRPWTQESRELDGAGFTDADMMLVPTSSLGTFIPSKC